MRAAVLNSSLSSADAALVERRMRAGELDLVYIAPERLTGERCQRLLGDVQRTAGIALSRSTRRTAFHNGDTTSGPNTDSFAILARALQRCRVLL